MYGVADKYVRLQEYPFSSEQKMMAVKTAVEPMMTIYRRNACGETSGNKNDKQLQYDYKYLRHTT